MPALVRCRGVYLCSFARCAASSEKLESRVKPTPTLNTPCNDFENFSFKREESTLAPLSSPRLCTFAWLFLVPGEASTPAVMAEEGSMSAPVDDLARGRFEDAIDAAKVGDQHRIRLYLDRFGGNVNLRDRETQGTLLHVSTHCCFATRSSHQLAQRKRKVASYVHQVLHL